jgi:hypothetical protein
MMTELYIYVSGTDRERIESYAAEFGLDEPGLSNLLLHRELRVGHLARLDRGRVKQGGARKSKIVAQLESERVKEFVSRAKTLHLSRSAAGALLLLHELEEQWLRKAVEN